MDKLKSPNKPFEISKKEVLRPHTDSRDRAPHHSRAETLCPESTLRLCGREGGRP